MKIGGREVGYGNDPFIVAEIGGAHNGSFDTAIALIDAAKWAGCDAVKFQCFTPDGITFNGGGEEFIIKKGPWAGRTLHSLYSDTYTPREWFPKLFEHAYKIGIAAFSSVFAHDDVDFLVRLKQDDVFKISSFELIDLPLIEYASRGGRNIIMSTGMASHDEIFDAVLTATRENNVTLLRCVSAYPTSIADSRIHTMMPGDGISDHSTGVDVAIAAAARGASIIEKHITLSREAGGPDDAFAMEPRDFAYMVRTIRAVHISCFKGSSTRADAIYQPFRKSLYAVDNIKRGYAITTRNVRSIRPGNGLAPKELVNVVGRRAAVDIKAGTPMSWSLVDD